MYDLLRRLLQAHVPAMMPSPHPGPMDTPHSFSGAGFVHTDGQSTAPRVQVKLGVCYDETATLRATSAPRPSIRALAWRCEPARWSLDTAAGGLRIEPDAETDFWQRTHYGFQVDNGHFLFAEVDGDFVLTTHASFRPVHQYDQAGLMVRLSADCWLKTSIEYEPGPTNRLGAVVTNAGYSDWSTQEVPERRRRRSGCASPAPAPTTWSSRRQTAPQWTQLRLAHLHDDDGARVSAGLYACSPKAAGYQADFAFLEIKAAPGRCPGRVASQTRARAQACCAIRCARGGRGRARRRCATSARPGRRGRVAVEEADRLQVEADRARPA